MSFHIDETLQWYMFINRKLNVRSKRIFPAISYVEGIGSYIYIFFAIFLYLAIILPWHRSKASYRLSQKRLFPGAVFEDDLETGRNNYEGNTRHIQQVQQRRENVFWVRPVKSQNSVTVGSVQFLLTA